MPTLYRFLMLLAAVSSFSSTGWAADHVKLRVVSWNVQAGGSDANVLANQMVGKQNVALWGLSEVDPNEFGTFRLGAQFDRNSFHCIEGSSGGDARLAIIYNSDRFDLLAQKELAEVQLGSTSLCAPLIAHLRCRKTNFEFLFVVNHLPRGNGSQQDEKRRTEQARLINDWAGKVNLPAILVGTFNADFDCRFGNRGIHSPMYDELVRKENLKWIRPQTLVRTQTSFDCVSDFIFVANPSRMPPWNGVGRILNRVADSEAMSPFFYDDSLSSDHRPVDAIFTLPVRDGRVEANAEGEPPSA